MLQNNLLRKDPIPLSLSLREYIREGVDKFYFREHFHNWYKRYTPSQPIMFIRYEAMFDHIENILNFLEIPIAFKHLFPKEKEKKFFLRIIIS